MTGLLFPNFTEAESEATLDFAGPAWDWVRLKTAASSVVVVAAAASTVDVVVYSSPVPSELWPSVQMREVKSEHQTNSSIRSVVQQWG